jgi:hypothetical protein
MSSGPNGKRLPAVMAGSVIETAVVGAGGIL